MTLHRIETGSPSVTMGAYMNAAAALGMQLTLANSDPAPEPASAEPQPISRPDTTIRVGDYPQLRAISWQLRNDTELTQVEALHLYERNWRHIDQDAMGADERRFVQFLADTHSAGVLLV